MSFDIQYLLWLQELRNATGGVFDEFFNALSKFAVDILPFIPYIIFWGLDKKWGYRFITASLGSDLINGILKLTVCAYRPWIRSDLIQPAGDSKIAATGYSFPSGHSTAATCLYGSVFVWQRDRRKWLAVVMAIAVVLTCFSRNYLGVHTPQDVCVAFLCSSLIIFIVGVVGEKVGDNQQVWDKLTIAGIVLVVLVLIYIQVKPYPLDYVDGELLVDPQRMMNDTFKSAGAFFGFLIGSYYDRHYLHYEIPTGEAAKKLPVLVAVGAGLMFAWKQYFEAATLVQALGGHWGNFISRCLLILFAMILWPMVIQKECKEAA